MDLYLDLGDFATNGNRCWRRSPSTPLQRGSRFNHPSIWPERTIGVGHVEHPIWYESIIAPMDWRSGSECTCSDHGNTVLIEFEDDALRSHAEAIVGKCVFDRMSTESNPAPWRATMVISTSSRFPPEYEPQHTHALSTRTPRDLFDGCCRNSMNGSTLGKAICMSYGSNNGRETGDDVELRGEASLCSHSRSWNQGQSEAM